MRKLMRNIKTLSKKNPKKIVNVPLKMFELGKVSYGRAAELAGMSRVDFLEICGRYNVSVFNYPIEEVEQELKKYIVALKKVSKQ